MKYIKTYEEAEITGVDYVPSEREHPSYKNEEKKKKRKKLGKITPIEVIPNHTKDIISFKPKNN